MHNLSFEKVNTDWFDPNALRLPNYKVGRVNFGKGRSYVRINPDGSLESPLKLYTSLTTAINTCAPMERSLLEWHCKLGLKEAERYTQMKQHYGTLLHLEIGKFLIEKAYDFDLAGDVCEAYLSEHSYWQPECKQWPEDIKYDMAAFIQFFHDYKIIPLGIEYVLLSEKSFGTLIDLVCKITVEEKGYWGEVYKSGANKGQPKETKKAVEKTAIINFKSGRHSFYRTNGIQIECEKQLWEENFPDMPIDCAMNWSPKEWKSNPGYNVKDWSGEICQQEIDAILALAQVRYASRAENKTYLNISGVVSSLESLGEALGRESIEDYCNRKYGVQPEKAKKVGRVDRQPVRKAEKEKADMFTSEPLPI